MYSHFEAFEYLYWLCCVTFYLVAHRVFHLIHWLVLKICSIYCSFQDMRLFVLKMPILINDSLLTTKIPYGHRSPECSRHTKWLAIRFRVISSSKAREIYLHVVGWSLVKHVPYNDACHWGWLAMNDVNAGICSLHGCSRNAPCVMCLSCYQIDELVMNMQPPGCDPGRGDADGSAVTRSCWRLHAHQICLWAPSQVMSGSIFVN